jgi:hypothetical protein
MGYTSSYKHTVLDKNSGTYAGEKDLCKYFAFGEKAIRESPEFRREISSNRIQRVAHLDSQVVPGSNFYASASWIWPEEHTGPKEQNISLADRRTHAFPEIIAFFGTDFTDIHKLHGEVELWVQGKQYKMDKSFTVYIPGGVEYGPLTVRNIRKPIFYFNVGFPGVKN